ncbi:MAG: hypothetical protein Q8N81_00790 [bacterium]|nr:hypothetical protein [bacterium]
MNWGKCRPATRLNWAIYALTIPVLTAPLYYEFAGPSNTPVTFEGDHATVRPLGAFVWEHGGKFSNIPTSLPIGVYGDVRPITSNPKVRDLCYELRVNIANLDRFFADPKNRNLGFNLQDKIYGTSFSQFSPGYSPQNVTDKIGVTTLDLLYRFNDTHSRELAAFYNPLDPEQLRALKSLVEPWVNERLDPHGLRAELRGFTVK